MPDLFVPVFLKERVREREKDRKRRRVKMREREEERERERGRKKTAFSVYRGQRNKRSQTLEKKEKSNSKFFTRQMAP